MLTRHNCKTACLSPDCTFVWSGDELFSSRTIYPRGAGYRTACSRLAMKVVAMFLEGSLVEQLRQKAHVGEVFRVPLLSRPWVGGGSGEGVGESCLNGDPIKQYVSFCEIPALLIFELALL